MKEHLRAVIWPRDQNPKVKTEAVLSKDGKKVYRYAIVGLLITEKPLVFSDDNELLIDDSVQLGHQLEGLHQRQLSRRVSGADDVLVSLEDL